MGSITVDMAQAEAKYRELGGNILEYASDRLRRLVRDGYVEVCTGYKGLTQFFLKESSAVTVPSKPVVVKDTVTLKEVQVWLKSKIRNNNTWALRALQIVYANQTEDEKDAALSIVNNKKGFGSMDAEILTSFAQRAEQNKPFSEKQLNCLRMIVSKYWKQVLDKAGLGVIKPLVLKDLSTF